MSSTKRRKSYKNICSKLLAGTLLVFSMITLTACGTTKAKETKNQTKETKKWEPLKISEQEKTQAQKEVKQISTICQNIKIDKNKVTKKDLENLYQILTKKGYPTAQVDQESHGTKNAPVKFKPSKTSHGDKLKTFYKQAKAGKTDEIRPCIGCGRCLTGIMFGKPISCTVNPAVEKEEIDEAPVKKKVLVVGGGPAGMEAAYVAKKRGHEVVLCEQSDRLGGQLNIACVPIGKQEITKVVKYMKSQLTGVDVRLNTTVTKEMIENEFKDYEVITTVGATPKEIEPYKVFKQTMTADDILSGKKFPGRKIVIIGGGSVGCETADYLAPLINDLFPTNRDITLIEMTKGLMTGESGATKSLLTRRMMEKGVKIELNSKITYVDENTIKYEKNHQEYVLDDVDTLVFAVGYNPVASPIENAHLIGDCQKVGTLKDAITNAYQITKEI